MKMSVIYGAKVSRSSRVTEPADIFPNPHTQHPKPPPAFTRGIWRLHLQTWEQSSPDHNNWIQQAGSSGSPHPRVHVAETRRRTSQCGLTHQPERRREVTGENVGVIRRLLPSRSCSSEQERSRRVLIPAAVWLHGGRASGTSGRSGSAVF